MVKKIVALVLIVAAAGTWFYLDQLNKQALEEAAKARQDVERARAQAKMRADAKAKVESEAQATLTSCKADAEKAKNDYLTQHQQPVRRKPGQFTIPQDAQDEAAKAFDAANAACQSAYDQRLAQSH